MDSFMMSWCTDRKYMYVKPLFVFVKNKNAYQLHYCAADQHLYFVPGLVV